MPDNTTRVKTRVRNNPLILRIEAGFGIGIYKSVFRVMGYPQNILFWWSETEKTLLISAGSETNVMSIPIPFRCYSQTSGFTSTNKRLVGAICKYAGLEHGSKSKIIGRFIPEINMVAFRISEARTEADINA